MEPFLMKGIQLLLSLSLLIILHELGHFIPARIFKTRVEKFYLFFDVKFSLFKKKIGETVYGIGWLPLGGYVKISGMIDESMDTKQMQEPPKEWEFRINYNVRRRYCKSNFGIFNLYNDIICLGEKYTSK